MVWGESIVAETAPVLLNTTMARVLFLGDIVGRAGRQAVIEHIQSIRESERLDLVIANGENAAGGSGLTKVIAEELHAAGIDGITLGDHAWDQRGFDKDIEDLPFVCRPFNLFPGSPGKPHLVVEANGFRLGVVTMLGQQLVKISSGAGFPVVGEYVDNLRGECDAVLLETHAETTSEKVALGWYLDGRVAAVIGTHTHIPTADARVLPRGTGYITDAGMSGPYDSVLGRDIEPIVRRFVDGLPRRFTVAEENVQLHGVIFEAEKRKRGCQSFERFVFIPEGR